MSFFIFEDVKFKSSQITNNYLEELQSLEVAYLFVDLFPLVVWKGECEVLAYELHSGPIL